MSRTHSLDALVRDARNMLDARGHVLPTLADWTQTLGMGRGKHGRQKYSYECARCGRSVVIDNKPMADPWGVGVAIEGSATTVECGS